MFFVVFGRKPRKIPLQEFDFNLADRHPGGRTQTRQPKVQKAEKSSCLPSVIVIGEVSWSLEGIAFLILK